MKITITQPSDDDSVYGIKIDQKDVLEVHFGSHPAFADNGIRFSAIDSLASLIGKIATDHILDARRKERRARVDKARDVDAAQVAKDIIKQIQANVRNQTKKKGGK